MSAMDDVDLVIAAEERRQELLQLAADGDMCTVGELIDRLGEDEAKRILKLMAYHNRKR